MTKNKTLTLETIPGYEGLYSITRDGMVWLHKSQKYPNGRWLTPTKHKQGYLSVKLHGNGADKYGKRINVHRLVALTYIPNPDNLPEVNHLNGIKDDNRVENLEWCTASENMRHAFSMGLIAPRRQKEAA